MDPIRINTKARPRPKIAWGPIYVLIGLVVVLVAVVVAVKVNQFNRVIKADTVEEAQAALLALTGDAHTGEMELVGAYVHIQMHLAVRQDLHPDVALAASKINQIALSDGESFTRQQLRQLESSLHNLCKLIAHHHPDLTYDLKRNIFAARFFQ